MSGANLILNWFHWHDRTLLTTAFCTYVRPLFEYCSPHTQCLINKIEKVQRYFTKRVARLWNIRDCWHFVYSHSVINELILFYKIKNSLSDSDIRNNFIVADNLNTCGQSCKLNKQHCTKDATKFCFSNHSVTIWISLLEDVVSALSVTDFKNKLLQFTVTLCFGLFYMYIFHFLFVSFFLIVLLYMSSCICFYRQRNRPYSHVVDK